MIATLALPIAAMRVMILQCNRTETEPMKNLFSKTPIALGFAAALLASACTQTVVSDVPEETAETGSKTLQTPATVKPGAAVEFSHEITAAAAPGGTGTVKLTVIEGYDAGTLTLTTGGTDPLSVFGVDTTKTVDMASGGTHSWTVNYNAATDGIYYLNVQAAAAPDAGPEMSRVYAVRIEVGDISKAEKPQSPGDVMVTPDGETIIVMEAEETIE